VIAVWPDGCLGWGVDNTGGFARWQVNGTKGARKSMKQSGEEERNKIEWIWMRLFQNFSFGTATLDLEPVPSQTKFAHSLEFWNRLSIYNRKLVVLA
jgi:hypothetical protein